MAVPVTQSAFTTGEISPGLYGRFDLPRFHVAATTLRNMFPSYRGGAYSRAGTRFVGYSKQTGTLNPPRLMPFQFSITQGLVLEFGDLYMRVVANGAFVTEGPIAITAATRANPCVVSVANTWSVGDWVFISGVAGMTQLNGQTYVISARTAGTITLKDVFGNTINSTAFGLYTGGGTAARLFTLATPYAVADLAWLKYTQSANLMSLCCVNPVTGVEYAPRDLQRLTDSNWTLTIVDPSPTITSPGGLTGTASAVGTVNYQYKVTAVGADGSESTPTSFAQILNAVNVASTAGTITIGWAPVAGAIGYNIYKATPAVSVAMPSGVAFGFAGEASGTGFIDSNIVADFTQVPPTHYNPFARGQILRAVLDSSGAGYTNATVTINSATGSSGVLLADISTGGGGGLNSIIIIAPGENYLPGDTITITGNGTGATGHLVLGALSGTYPAVPAYFQQRRVYASTLNNPDTYFMSEPGSYTNFDSRIPTISSDAIIGTPWGVHVDGIQFMLNMPAGLLVMTGASAWLLAGAGSFATNVSPISPSSQNAVSQVFSGCSPTVPPIRINYDTVYVTSKGSLYYALPYQLYSLAEPIDLTANSTHLFTALTINSHTWAEQPSKILWSVRSDGVLLSMTYLKSEQVSGWARHDTAGLFQSVCSVTELPVDAVYFAVYRVAGNGAFMIERMDDRLWRTAEDAWCVDAGLSLPQPIINTAITADSPTGLGAIRGVTGLVGGSGYSALTTARVVDNNGLGPGTGATPQLTIAGGVITSVSFPIGGFGSGYVNPKLVFDDPSNSGSGTSATLTLDNAATFSTASDVFTAANLGSVIRMGGGVATITQILSTTAVSANITSPITSVTIVNGKAVVALQAAGTWTMTAPVTTISGLNHLANVFVTGLADGNIIPPVVVPANGTITLARAASAVTIGLGFQAQLQSVYLDGGEPAAQGQRKKIAAVTARIEASRDLKIGTNQPDGSAQSPIQIAPQWTNLDTVPNTAVKPYNSNFTPLFTGDVRIPVQGGYDTRGQVALQQDNPVPMQVLALIPEILGGDQPETHAQPKQRQKQAA